MEQANWYTFNAKGETAEISIHDEIGYGEGSALAFMESFKELDKKQPVSLSIHSPGGSVLDGWAIYNLLKAHEGEITGRVVGFAGSMASVLLTACDHVEQPEDGWQMIHNPTAGAWGEAPDLENMAETLKKMQKGIVRAYSKKTLIPEDEIQELMDATTYMDGKEAVAKGFASRILKPVKAAALSEDWKQKLPQNNFPEGLVFGSTSAPPEQPKQPEPAQKPEIQPTDNIPSHQNMSEPSAPEPKAPDIKDILAQDKPRRDEIKAIGARFKLEEKEVVKAIEEGTDLESFRAHVLDNFSADAFAPVPQPDKLNQTGELGSPEAKNYSVFKAIKEMRASGSVSGLEKEVQDELSARYRAATGDVPSGLLIPGEWLSANASGGIRNAATVGTGTSGGNTVATEMQSLTDYLKDYSILPTVGASIFRDSEGNLEFPRATAGYSGTWDAETDTISNADATLAANLTLSPKRVGAGTAISKQLLAQSSMDFEGWVRGELLYAIATAVDRAAITGSGSSDQPTGLLSASGTGSYTWVTGTSAWENIVAQWKVLRAAKAPMRSVAWLFDENVRADWSGTPKVANASAFVYEQMGNAMSGSVYGFPGYDHTDVTANKVILGDFSQLMVAMWGGIELIVDPYSKKTSGQVELYAQTFADVGVRQPGAFVIGNDGTDHAGAIA